MFVPPGVPIDCHCFVLGYVSYHISVFDFSPKKSTEENRTLSRPSQKRTDSGSNSTKINRNTMTFENLLDEFRVDSTHAPTADAHGMRCDLNH